MKRAEYKIKSRQKQANKKIKTTSKQHIPTLLQCLLCPWDQHRRSRFGKTLNPTPTRDIRYPVFVYGGRDAVSCGLANRGPKTGNLGSYIATARINNELEEEEQARTSGHNMNPFRTTGSIFMYIKQFLRVQRI